MVPVGSMWLDSATATVVEANYSSVEGVAAHSVLGGFLETVSTRSGPKMQHDPLTGLWELCWVA